MAPPAGLEPATYSLGNCRSVLMSYGGVGRNNNAVAADLAMQNLKSPTGPVPIYYATK